MGGVSKPLYYDMFHIVHQLERRGRQVWLLLRLVHCGEICDMISWRGNVTLGTIVNDDDDLQSSYFP
jgi:hypothetical protein